MKIAINDPPRIFHVGRLKEISIKDCARIELAPDEQVTFWDSTEKEYDVTCKSWGYYATPSLNGRLRSFNLRPALVLNNSGKMFLLIITAGCEVEYETYLEEEAMEHICWLDSDKAVANAVQALRNIG